MNAYEQNASRALVQGTLMGAMMTMMQHRTGPILVTNIVQSTDEDGAYLPYFDVTLFSGTEVRIAITLCEDVAKAVDVVIAAQQERIVDFERRVRADVETTLGRYGIHAGFGGLDRDQWEDLASDLTNDALHPIEQLLTEER